ncbi:UpxY family transcription antiterminator [Kordia jejudonensis]|uniref:UpxY family transcription antiterminator n=1 Tax=Kordia jejudonensis TaxID=1348245 RepID=UPI000629723C|nr:UpxY family transcription antiterminator [Kordia jejudonensis]
MKFYAGWYVLYVRSRWENRVHEHLQDIAVESFLPKVKVVKQWSDRKKSLLVPLFASYIFVNIKSSLEFHNVLSVNGAYFYIQFGDTYAKLTEEEIEQIRLLVNNEYLNQFSTHDRLPKIGETKKIMHGPLRGLNCEIIEADKYSKIIVRIDSLHQSIQATMSLDYFESET